MVKDNGLVCAKSRQAGQFLVFWPGHLAAPFFSCGVVLPL
jgi:hypothetical protein